MSWQVLTLFVVALVCGTALAAWWLFLIHDDEPVDD